MRCPDCSREVGRRVLAEQETPPWFGSPLSASSGHLALVDEQGRPRVFALSPR